MKTLKTVALTVIIFLAATLGISGPAHAADYPVSDYLNSWRNKNGVQSLPADAQLNAIAQRAAETRQPVSEGQLPAEYQQGMLGYTYTTALKGSNGLAMEAMKTTIDGPLLLNAGWNRMGTGSAVVDGQTYAVVLLAKYPAKVAPPAVPQPAPAPVVDTPQPPSTPVIEEPPAQAQPEPAPVVAEVEPEPEPVKEEPKEEVKPTPSAEPSPTASPTPEVTETQEAEAVAVSNTDIPAGLSVKEVIQTLTGIASVGLALIALITMAFFLRHRKLGKQQDDDNNWITTTA